MTPMDDAEAEALLMALGSQLTWRIPLLCNLHATSREGQYAISPSRGKYTCRFTPWSGRRSDAWAHQTPDLAVAKQACDWHATKGKWPTFWEEGWEHTKE